MNRFILLLVAYFLLSTKVYSQLSESNCIRMLVYYAKWEPISLMNHLASLTDPWVVDSDYYNNSSRRVMSAYKKPYRITTEFNNSNKKVVLATPSYALDRIMAIEEMKSLGLDNTMNKKRDDGFSIEIWDDMGKYNKTSTIIVVIPYKDRIEYSASID